jgi:hypothetical protein
MESEGQTESPRPLGRWRNPPLAYVVAEPAIAQGHAVLRKKVQEHGQHERGQRDDNVVGSQMVEEWLQVNSGVSIEAAIPSIASLCSASIDSSDLACCVNRLGGTIAPGRSHEDAECILRAHSDPPCAVVSWNRTLAAICAL